jgi:phosphoserine phosphatase
MIKSLNCEIQAYGVTGLEMLQKKDFQISYKTQQLINYIKKRNTELVICSGCFSGVIEKIYTNE